ncbi:MAG: hypothetical protein QOH71_741 [Blastocatellia bacterium]|jgi:hypothetical protein|nr:hypothetical protein [Blastocatellia bacterium]
MSAATEIIIDQARPRAISLRWIINAREDLIWFVGSVASSYALLILYVTGVLPLIPMVVGWAILIDAPHVFGTLSRTYFDRSEWKTRKRLMLGSLLFFVIGPAMVLLGFGFTFFFLAALWAYYHLVKQHYGFMVLYKKKNNDLAPVDNALDRLLLMFAFNYPFLAFIASDPSAMARVPPFLRSGVNLATMFLLAGTIIVGGCWLIRQLQRAWLREPLNLPKYLLLAAAIPMHWIALLTPMPNKPIALVAILTTYHNLQYHRLIWFHNQKYVDASSRRSLAEVKSAGTERQSLSALGRGRAANEVASDLSDKYGPAALISRRLLYYIAFGVFFGLLYQGPRQVLGYFGLKASHGDVTAQLPIPIQLGVAVLWGVAFIHYYLDSKIWRVRRDPSVGKALNMT